MRSCSIEPRAIVLKIDLGHHPGANSAVPDLVHVWWEKLGERGLPHVEPYQCRSEHQVWGLNQVGTKGT